MYFPVLNFEADQKRGEFEGSFSLFFEKEKAQLKSHIVNTILKRVESSQYLLCKQIFISGR